MTDKFKDAVGNHYNKANTLSWFSEREKKQKKIQLNYYIPLILQLLPVFFLNYRYYLI